MNPCVYYAAYVGVCLHVCGLCHMILFFLYIVVPDFLCFTASRLEIYL